MGLVLGFLARLDSDVLYGVYGVFFCLLIIEHEWF